MGRRQAQGGAAPPAQPRPAPVVDPSPPAAPVPTAAPPSREEGAEAREEAAREEAAREEAARVSTDDARWAREAEALASVQPTRAALLHSFRARAAFDLDGDETAAARALGRAAELAPDARFVALTRRWIAERGRDPAAVVGAARAEIPLAGDAPERAVLLWQVASIEQHAAGRPDAAERALRDLVALDHLDVGAHLALAAIAARQEHWLAAAEAWR